MLLTECIVRNTRYILMIKNAKSLRCRLLVLLNNWWFSNTAQILCLNVTCFIFYDKLAIFRVMSFDFCSNYAIFKEWLLLIGFCDWNLKGIPTKQKNKKSWHRKIEFLKRSSYLCYGFLRKRVRRGNVWRVDS